MSRKSLRISKQLDHASIALDDPQLIIRNELRNYITRQQALRKRILNYVLRSLGVAVVLFLAYVYIPKIVAFIHYQIRYAATFSRVDVINRNTNVIKLGALSQLPVDSFKEYEFNGEKAATDTTRIAVLIHRYNTDFYGKVNNLSAQYEQRLLAYILQNGYSNNDYCTLDRNLVEDSTKTLRSFILSKVYGEDQSSDYFNPIIDELSQSIVLYQQRFDVALNRQLNDETIKAIRKQVVEKKIAAKAVEPMIDLAVQYCGENPESIAEVVYYRRKIDDFQLELDLRLSLLYMAIGKDYKVRGDSQNFGWLKGGYKGKTFIKDRSAPEKYSEYYKRLTANLSSYHSLLADAREIFDQVALEEWHLRIDNPLKIGLKVKDVGLYGARRKTRNGDYYEHRGIDLIAKEGTPVYAVQDGFVTNVESSNNGGNLIEIWHDSNVTSVYAHLKNGKLWHEMLNRFKSEGPFWVSKQNAIAHVGLTGNIPEDSAQYGYAHLHLEIREYNRYKNPFLLLNQQITVFH